MKDILVLLCVLAAFALGALPMKRLDRFLDRNRAAVERGQDRRAREEAPARAAARWSGRRLIPLKHRIG